MNMIEQRNKAFLDADHFRSHYLGGFVPEIRQEIQGKSFLSNEDLLKAIVILKIGIEICNINPDFALMKKEMIKTLERYEDYKRHRRI